MATYGQYCPIAQALDLIGDRWTLLIVRDMLTGTKHFNDLMRGLPGISRALLAKRLRQLEDDGIIEKCRNDGGRRSTEYVLTEAGNELQNVINSLLIWGTTWAFSDPREEDLDPLLLMWWMKTRVNLVQLPPERITIQFDFHAPKSDTYWLVLSRDNVEICVTDPGFDLTLRVLANLESFFKVWLGKLNYDTALQNDHIQIEGLPRFQRAFPDWFMWSLAAPTVRSIPSRRSSAT